MPKTVDVKVHALAEQWLKAGGWMHDQDVMKLAGALQECCEEFTAELEAEYEEACNHEHQS